MDNLVRAVYRKSDIRGEALGQVVDRLNKVEGRATTDVTPVAIATALKQLEQRGCLMKDGEGWSYAPSYSTRQTLFEAEPTTVWTEKLVKKQKAAFRSSPGAIVRLPIEESSEAVETFITDWSPFPAAAAVAVHAMHPLAGGGNGDRFTGRFVRHPLTGDLLPVWVASWVRPDFGTGAVVVNPGHSAVDLDFAQRVGLPIRFALADSAITCDSATWPAPPVIKRGKTIRTGRFDGLEVDQAMVCYFDELFGKGWAKRLTDRAVGSLKVATSSESHEPILEAVLGIEESQALELYWPAGEIESSLLFARMLHLELNGQPLEPLALRLWQRADVAKIPEPHDLSLSALGLSALIAGPIDQVVVIKPQTLDQCRLFVKNHEVLVAGDLDDKAATALRTTRRDLLAASYHTAFNTLYTLQKQATKEGKQVAAPYFALAYVLAGLAVPATLNVAELWRALS